jgi:flagellar motility protein MotE (MotC chaperone)
VRTPIEILVKAIHILANDIQSDDGVANAAIYEAAQRLEEQNQRIKRLEEAGDEMEQWTSEYGPIYRWRKAKEDKL